MDGTHNDFFFRARGILHEKQRQKNALQTIIKLKKASAFLWAREHLAFAAGLVNVNAPTGVFRVQNSET